MNLNPSTNVVLLGAGFTKNFGGFLAKEMWENIFSHPSIQQSGNLRASLMSDPEYNYETILFNVLTGNYTPEEKTLFYKVVEEVYQFLDKSVFDYCENDMQSKGISLRGVKNLLTGTFSESGKKHFLFTLNQDLFLERAGAHRSPFVDLVGQGNLKFSTPFREEYSVVLPTTEELEERKKHFEPYGAWHYTKLHGSYGWKSALGGRGMVIGKNKLEEIQKEPLLKLNYEIFEQVLTHDNRLLMIIGYGFKDDHINKVIIDGIKNHGLKIYLISPGETAKIMGALSEVDEALPKALVGCKFKTLYELFPYRGDRNTVLDSIFTQIKVK